MVKKIQIFLLIFFFFGSTTSLPISINLCKMMEEASKNSCKMNMSEKMNSIHCQMKSAIEKNNTQNIKLPNCCCSITKSVNIKDDFVLTQSITSKDLKTKILSKVFLTINSDIQISKLYQTNKAPPKTVNNKIFLTFSLLLI